MFYNINSFEMAALIPGQVVARIDDFFQSIGVEHSAAIGKICIRYMGGFSAEPTPDDRLHGKQLLNALIAVCRLCEERPQCQVTVEVLFVEAQQNFEVDLQDLGKPWNDLSECVKGLMKRSSDQTSPQGQHPRCTAIPATFRLWREQLRQV